jgi:hypothetical protein
MRQKTASFSSALVLILVCISSFTGSAQTYDGYTLYSKMGNTNTYLIDMSGSVYHTWTSSVQTGYSCYLLANHHLLRSGSYSGNVLQGAAMTGMVQDYDWNGNLTWQYIYSTANYCSHHDIHPMPNGNVLMISYEVKTAAEVTQAGGAQSIVMWPDKIIEVQPSGSTGGTIVWEWHIWDHLVQENNSSKSNYGVVANHPELLNINYQQTKDWMHTNGIDYNPVLDQIVISSHNMNEIYVIDHSTTTAQAATHSGGNSGKGGDILYRWGNPAAYNQGTASNKIFNVVHDAHWIPNGYPWANRLVAFNNKGATGSHSCVDMIYPPYNGYTYTYSGGAFTPSSYLWRHTCLGDAQDQSSSQKLPNGNLFVCISSNGYLYEIDSNQVLKWSKTVGGTVCKAYRYSPCYVNGALATTATATPAAICSGGSVQLSAGVTGGGTTTTYSWTSIPAGFTSTLQTPTANPTATTIYVCTATSDGCSGSDSVTVTLQATPTVTSTANPSVLCPVYGTQLNVTVSGTGTYTYNWTSIPAGFTSTLQNPVAYPAVNTIYIASVSGNGCSGSDSISVTMGTPPAVTASAAPDVVCSGSQVQLYSSATGSMNYAYSWTSLPSGFMSTSQNPVASPAVTTTYIATAGSNGCTASDSALVTVNPLPSTPVISAGGDTLTSSAASGNQWYLEYSQIPGATGQTWIAQVNGNYQVVVTDVNGCTSAMSASVYVLVNGTDDLSGTNSVAVIPNPTNGQVALSGSIFDNTTWTVSIYDHAGRPMAILNNTRTVDLSAWENGLYCLVIRTGNNTPFVKKVILIK